MRIELGSRSYPIWIGAGLLDDADRWRRMLRGRHVLVVSNSVVAPLYLDQVCAGLQGMNMATLILEDGETFKTMASMQRIFDALAKLGASRDACILALGGGVTGDMTGFAAACWMRGVDFMQIPTTLLAMVDASVGGKTGVNLAAGKNLVGAFHQPLAVVIDTDTLATLPDREYHAGFAEVIKHAAIGDARFFARLQDLAPALLARDPAALAEIIEHACRFKAAIVTRDETEQGERALLNFGHTFAHALETETGYASLLHGEAVAIGMCLAAELSTRLDMAPASDAERLATLLQRFKLPTTTPAGIHPDALLTHMQLDKKSHDGQLCVILWRGIGCAEIVDGVARNDLRAVLGSW